MNILRNDPVYLTLIKKFKIFKDLFILIYVEIYLKKKKKNIC